MKIKLEFKKVNENIINVPFFVFRDLNKPSNKLFFLLKSRVAIFIVNTFEKNLFCKLMNFLYRVDGDIEYSVEKFFYYKNYGDMKIAFPNKYRILGSMVNTKYELDNLLNSFNLDGFELNEGDTVVDCGANTGMFYIALMEYNTNFKYYGFEPDKNVFRCLEENISTFESNILINIALSNENSQKKLYIDSDHGDSSLEKFASEVTSEVRVSTLDSYNFKKIKLLKMDAEGHEYEVLEGSKKTLKNIEFICVDMGNEKGFENENTVASVTNYLLKNKFELLRFNEERTVGLFKNINTN